MKFFRSILSALLILSITGVQAAPLCAKMWTEKTSNLLAVDEDAREMKADHSCCQNSNEESLTSVDQTSASNLQRLMTCQCKSKLFAQTASLLEIPVYLKEISLYSIELLSTLAEERDDSRSVHFTDTQGSPHLRVALFQFVESYLI